MTVTERTAVAKTAAAEAKVILKIKEICDTVNRFLMTSLEMRTHTHVTSHTTTYLIRFNDSTLKYIYIGDEIDGC